MSAFSDLWDVIIIGAGPAGLSSYLYTKRAGLKSILINSFPICAGQVVNTSNVDNYLGFKSISGSELSQQFYEHAKSFGNNFYFDAVTSVSENNGVFTVKCPDKLFTSKAIIISTGAKHRKLNVDGEERFQGKGISYCATCDGNFFRNKKAVVIGGGDSAAENALYLSKICSDVMLVYRADKLKANKLLQNNIFNQKNIKVLYNTLTLSINGNTKVESILLKNKITNERLLLNTDCVFIAVGMEPESSLVKDLVQTDKKGYIIADESCKTTHMGIFAAGDVRTKRVRQIATAVSDGANAVFSLEEYLY